MAFKIEITGNEDGKSLSWSKDITFGEAASLINKIESDNAKRRTYETLISQRRSQAFGHRIQDYILELASREDISDYTLRKIGAALPDGPYHPQRITHHLNQLIKKGLMNVDRSLPSPITHGE
jgi:hypothetical protein